VKNDRGAACETKKSETKIVKLSVNFIATEIILNNFEAMGNNL
jgi:hypothetical protein